MLETTQINYLHDENTQKYNPIIRDAMVIDGLTVWRP